MCLLCCLVFTVVAGLFYHRGQIVGEFYVCLLCCLIFTQITEVLYTFMFRFLVKIKTALCCCHMSALFTGIFYMDRLSVSLKISPIWLFLLWIFYSSVFVEFSSILSEIYTCSQIFNIFVFILLVILEMCLLCCLIITLVTGIFCTVVDRLHNSFMCTTGVIQLTILTFKHCLTFLTLTQRLFQEVRFQFVKLFCFLIQLLARLKFITAIVECRDIQFNNLTVLEILLMSLLYSWSSSLFESKSA